MKAKFSLFQSHLDLAHAYWKTLVHPGDVVIDATCGNGQDTLILAQLCLQEGQGILYGIDILPKAIDQTKAYLQKSLSDEVYKRIRLIQTCHSNFPIEIPQESVQLITYNLGYLPGGGDKSLTTRVETTLESFQNALKLIRPGGAICITCYPGHDEGKNEEENLCSFVQALDPFQWNCCHHQWLNRKKSPSLLMIQKKLP